MKNARLLLILGCAAALAGCPDNTTVTDTSVDARVSDVPMGSDAGVDSPLPGEDSGTDSGTPDDAGTDSGTEEDDGGTPDAGTDGGMPLPAIVDPDPHTVAIAPDGHDRFYGVVFAPDSSFYVVGQTAAGTATPLDWETVVGHFNADGELDELFGEEGWFVVDLTTGTAEQARGIALQSDGRIVVSATIDDEDATLVGDRDIAVFRLDTDGSLDETFGEDGVRVVDLGPGAMGATAVVGDTAYGLAIDTMGRILVSGETIAEEPRTDADWAVIRLTADGDLDTTFSTDGYFTLDIAESNARARSISYLPFGGGLILASGYYGTPVQPIVYALDNTGSLATAFGGDGIYTEVVLDRQTEIYGVAVVGTQLVTTGYGGTMAVDDADNDLISLRLNSDGTRDLAYGPDGANGVSQLRGFTFGDNARALAALPDGRTIHVGAIRSAATEADAAIWILDGDGALDTTFDTDGAFVANTSPGTPDHFWAVAVDPRGERVVVVGIGNDDPAADDDGLVYLFEVP